MTFKSIVLMLLFLLPGAFIFVHELRYAKNTIVVVLGFIFFSIGAFMLLSEVWKTVIFTSGKVIRCFGITPLSRVAALQLLGVDINKWGRNLDMAYEAHELNLVLDDGSRVNILNHGDNLEMSKDAMLLARRLKCPIWTSDGELDPSPENLEACRKKIRRSTWWYQLGKDCIPGIEKYAIVFLLAALLLSGLLLHVLWYAFLEPSWD